MARGTNDYGLDAGSRRFDSGCAARFFCYETSVMSHQVESEGTFHFVSFFILKSWKFFIFLGKKYILMPSLSTMKAQSSQIKAKIF